jgi:hypothetical protein
LKLFSEDPEEQGEEEANDEAGDDGEVEAEVAFGVVDVTGQAAEPGFADAEPKQKADASDGEPDNYHEFSDVVHDGMAC